MVSFLDTILRFIIDFWNGGIFNQMIIIMIGYSIFSRVFGFFKKPVKRSFKEAKSKMRKEEYDLLERKIGSYAKRGTVVLILIALVLTIILAGPFAIVGPGERGVLTEFGAVKQVSLGEGFHWKIPIMQNMINMDVKTQKYVASASSASKDLQSVLTEVTLNYHIDPKDAWKIYQEIGIDFGDKVIQPAVQEVIKATTAKFNAEELITKRPLVKQEVEEALKIRLSEYNIIQETLSITEFSFSEQFNQAIEAKVTASQEVLEARTILERIEIEAQQKIAEANGQAEAKLTIARAETEALRLQKEVIDEKLLRLRAVEKWDGVMPRVTSGVLPFIDVAGIAEGD